MNLRDRPTKKIAKEEKTPFEELFGKIGEVKESPTETNCSSENPKKDSYKNTLLSIPVSLNKALDKYIGELKSEDFKIWDPVHQMNRKVSKSSFIVQLLEKELRNRRIIED